MRGLVVTKAKIILALALLNLTYGCEKTASRERGAGRGLVGKNAFEVEAAGKGGRTKKQEAPQPTPTVAPTESASVPNKDLVGPEGQAAETKGGESALAEPEVAPQTEAPAGDAANETMEDEAETAGKDDKTEAKVFTEEDVFKSLPHGKDQLKILCARPGQDKVRQVFCSTNPPKVTSLVEMQKALGLGIVDPTRVGRGNNGDGGNAAFTFTAGSSSLVGKFTSAINPRLIMFTPPNGADPSLVALGFLRGEQFVEVIAGDPSTNQLNFFLVVFEQACNATKEGCSKGELLTPSIEKNWTSFSIYEDHDLHNTIADCKHCHQPGGEGTPKMLRMQELRNPWTHFLRDNTDSGQALLADFQAAHGTDEDYAGIPAAMISSSEPLALERLVRQNGFADQPNEFPSRQIEREVRNAAPNQPEDNATMGRSETWDALYDQFVRGLAIAPPYHDVKVTDPAKLATYTRAYQDYRAGMLAEKDLPDITDVLLERGLRNMGFMVKAGLTGEGILMNACAQCHNSLQPQNISKAKFNVDLSKMSREEKDIAIARLKLPAEDPRRMPPARIRSLTPEEIDLLTKVLMK